MKECANSPVSSVNTTKSEERLRNPSNTKVVPAKLIKVGYYSGLIAFFLCLLLSLICISLFLYSTYFWMDSLTSPQIATQVEVFINGRLVMARIALLSCGVLAGLSFGFLGFSLFLIGVEGAINANFESLDYKATLSKMSPGVIVILIASILIGVCATRDTPFWYERTSNLENEKQLDESNEQQDTKADKNLPPKIELEKP